MTLTPVVSSNVKAVGYTDGTLVVQFHGAGPLVAAYRYVNVPPDVHAGLMAATSKGNYIHRNIARNPVYRAVKMTPAELQALEAAE